MKKCIVYLDDGILMSDAKKVIESVKMIKGVKKVSLSYTSNLGKSAKIRPKHNPMMDSRGLNDFNEDFQQNTTEFVSESSAQANRPVQNDPMNFQQSAPPNIPIQNNPMNFQQNAPPNAPIQNNPMNFQQNVPPNAPIQNNPMNFQQNVPPKIDPPSDDSQIANYLEDAPQTNFAQDNTFAPNPQTEPAPNTAQQAEIQRKIILEAIRWGITNQKIKPEQIKEAPIQDLVSVARRMIELMPDTDKKKFLNI